MKDLKRGLQFNSTTKMDEMTLRDSLIRQLFEMGLRYSEIRQVLIAEHGITLSLRQVKRELNKLHLYRRNYSNIHSVVNFIANELRESGQLHGYRMMAVRCREHGYNVRSNDVRIILQQLDPEGVSLRTARRFRRRSYFAGGPNFVWHIDGYDKLKPFGLCISGCICGFSRKMIWLNVYHTNNNPRVIGGYFVEAVQQLGGCPRFVRGDFGTENGHVRSFQTLLRGDTVEGQSSYIDGASTANQRIESWWGYLRREHMQYWIDLMKTLQYRGDFSGSILDKDIIQFCFLALIQSELDIAADMWNNHHVRASRNAMVPSGRSSAMYRFPTLWNAADHVYAVSDTDLAACAEEAEFRSVIPCDPDVYELCVNIMREANLIPANTAPEAIDLYLRIRAEIMSLL